MGDGGRKHVLEGLYAVSLICVPAYLLFADHGFNFIQSLEIFAVQLVLTSICGWLLTIKKRNK